MTEQEGQALASIARRLLRAEQISLIEANFIQTLITKLTTPAAPAGPAAAQQE